MLTSKQIAFCKQVSLGKSASEAYRIAYRSKSANTCKVNGSKLLKGPVIKAKIKELQAFNKKIAEQAEQKAMDQTASVRVATAAERMQLLTQIMHGEIKIPNTKLQYDARTGEFAQMEVLELPDHATRIKAIAELNRMDGSYEPDKLEVGGKLLPSWLKDEAKP